MKRNRKFALAAAVLFAATGFAAGAPPAKISAAVTDPAAKEVLSVVPLKDGSSTKEKVTAMLLALNEPQLEQIVNSVEIQGTDNEDRAHYALHGLAVALTKENAASRKALAEACAKRLATNTDASIKVFLIETLEYAGAVEAVPALAACLSDKALIDSALRALETIGGDEAKAAIRGALEKATDSRATILLAIARLRDEAALPAVRPLLKDTNAPVRIAAAQALANIGDAASAAPIAELADAAGIYDRAQLTSNLLLLARRLTEKKMIAEADAIYLSFWQRKPVELRHEKIAGLEGLVEVRGEAALPLVNEAMNSEDWQMRAAAARISGTVPGPKVTQMWIDQLNRSKNPAEILNVLANRKDPTAFEASSAMLNNKDEKIQVAAIHAVAATGGEKAIKPLLAIINSGGTLAKSAAIAALSANANNDGDAMLAGQLTGADAATKVSLLELLGSRTATAQQTAVAACIKDKEEIVRLAALAALEKIGDASMEDPLILATYVTAESEKTAAEKALIAVARRVPNETQRVGPIVAALAKADANGKVSLIRVLGQSNSKAATDPIAAALKDPSADVQDAAIRALSKSQDTAAMPALLEQARSGPTDTAKVFGLQGYLRLLEIQAVSKEEKLKLYAGVMPLATRPEEKRLIIGGLGKLESVAALDSVAGYLDQDAVRDEAAAAVVAIAQKLTGAQPDQLRPALEKAANATKNDKIKKQAQEMINRLPKKKV